MITKAVALGCVLMFQTAPIALAQAGAVPTADPGTLHTITALVDGRGFVRIEPGEFLMGSADGNPDEQPPRRVRITKAFELGKFEVTQAQWESVMRDPHAAPPAKAAPVTNPSHFKGPAKPVESVSWDEVQQFIVRINKRDPQHIYRLPTEAEWEYACRAGQPHSEVVGLEEVAWFEATSARETHPVGTKKPNNWGLYDMVGNVFEWVQDWYAPDYYAAGAATDPQGPASSSYKVYRGCAWLSPARQCRPTFRGFDFPNPGQYSAGFRLARTRR
jgi:formylglycine-generating enzyme required for sulfatase activity